MFIATFVMHQRKEYEALYLYSHCNCRTVSIYLSTSLSEAKNKNKWVYLVHRWPLHLEHVCRNGPPSHWKYRRPGLIRFHGTTSCPSRLDHLLCQMGVLIYTISTIWKAIRNAVLRHKWHPESLTFWGEHTGEVGRMCCAIWQTACLNNYKRNAKLCSRTSTVGTSHQIHACPSFEVYSHAFLHSFMLVCVQTTLVCYERCTHKISFTYKLYSVLLSVHCNTNIIQDVLWIFARVHWVQLYRNSYSNWVCLYSPAGYPGIREGPKVVTDCTPCPIVHDLHPAHVFTICTIYQSDSFNFCDILA